MEKRKFVVRKRLSGGARVFRAWAKWEVGDLILGAYKGETPNSFDAGKPNYAVDVEYAEFKDADLAASMVGKTLGLNNCGMLSKALDGLEIGTLIQVTYTGMGIIESGKFANKESHTLEVVTVSEEVEDTEEEEVL